MQGARRGASQYKLGGLTIHLYDSRIRELVTMREARLHPAATYLIFAMQSMCLHSVSMCSSKCNGRNTQSTILHLSMRASALSMVCSRRVLCSEVVYTGAGLPGSSARYMLKMRRMCCRRSKSSGILLNAGVLQE